MRGAMDFIFIFDGVRCDGFLFLLVLELSSCILVFASSGIFDDARSNKNDVAGKIFVYVTQL